jgi:hypothetical protein
LQILLDVGRKAINKIRISLSTPFNLIVYTSYILFFNSYLIKAKSGRNNQNLGVKWGNVDKYGDNRLIFVGIYILTN